MLSKIKSSGFFAIYIIWFIISFAIVFAKDGPSLDNITRVLILAYFGLTLFLSGFIASLRKKLKLGPKLAFILISVVSAAFVETFYMISKPLHTSLLITSADTFGGAVSKWLADIVLTAPFYIVIFFVAWLLINRYEYTPKQYLIVISIAQAIGDGSGFFLLNPGAAIFLPYVMINYHAMSFVPFRMVRSEIQPRSRSKIRFLIPLIIIPVVYVLGGIAIFTVGAFLGLL